MARSKKSPPLLRIRKNVWINQEPALFHFEVHAGDHITLRFEETDYQYQEVQLGKASFVQPLYEDDHLLIVNKPAGMKTHPNEPTENDTLLNHLAAYLKKKSNALMSCIDWTKKQVVQFYLLKIPLFYLS